MLEQHTHPWFTNLLYAPTGVGLLFHTLNAFNGFITLPIQLVFGLLPAYNTAVLFSFTLGGLGAYLLARHILGPGSSHLAAFAAGVIFTFSPFHIAHLLGHMQVISLEWIPFYALYLLRTVQCGLDCPLERASKLETGSRPLPAPRAYASRRIWRNALLAAFFLVLVALCDWYYVLYCLILTAVVVVWVLLRIALRRSAATRADRLDRATRRFPLTRACPHPGGCCRDLAALGRRAQPGAHPDAARSRAITFHGARPGAEPHAVGRPARFHDAAGVSSAVGQVGAGAGQAVHRLALRASGVCRFRRAGAGRAGCAARMARQEAGQVTRMGRPVAARAPDLRNPGAGPRPAHRRPDCSAAGRRRDSAALCVAGARRAVHGHQPLGEPLRRDGDAGAGDARRGWGWTG